MTPRTAGTVILLSTALFSGLLHAQSTPDSASDEAHVAAYCQALAKGHEQAEVLKNACQYALTVQRTLPNYVCDEKVRRISNTGLLQDVIDSEITVIDGKDSHSNVRVNGKQTEIAPSQLPGIWSSGQFGMLSPLLFAPENRASFVPAGEGKLNAHHALLFSFQVRRSENRTFFVLNTSGRRWKTGYKGLLWLDKETNRPVRIAARSTPMRIPSQWSSDIAEFIEVDTEYKDTPMADGTSFLLPARSSLRSCTFALQTGSMTCRLNELNYTNCHRFRANAKIVGVE